jgi:hypothetical protein
MKTKIKEKCDAGLAKQLTYEYMIKSLKCHQNLMRLSPLSDGFPFAMTMYVVTRMCLDPDYSPDEQEEKARLISQVFRPAQNV